MVSPKNTTATTAALAGKNAVNTPATPLLDWILNLNPASKAAPKLPMMILNVATNSVKAVPEGIEHNYTVTAANTSPEELKKMSDDAISSGAFTKTLKDAGDKFPADKKAPIEAALAA